MEQENTLLKVDNLEVTYHHIVVAVQGISIQVPANKIIGVLGINGAGKTTTLRAISGFIGTDNARITDGSIELCGERIDNKRPHEISHRGVRLIPDSANVFETLTTKENLEFGRLKGEERKEVLDIIYNQFPILHERRKQLAGYLSGGERRMLAISQGLLCRPKVLMLDEMSLGLSPKVVAEVIEGLLSLKEKLGLTMVVVEQNLMLALDFVDYAYIMEGGRIVFKGRPEELSSHEDVKEFYLGIAKDTKDTLKSYRDVKQYRRTRRWWRD